MVAVRVTRADEGIDVARTDGQNADRLGSVVAERYCQRVGALEELEGAADIDEVVDDDRDIAEGADDIGRIAELDRRCRQVASPIRVDSGLDDEATVRRKARAVGEVKGLRVAQVVLAAVDFDAEDIGADGDAVDADHLGAAAGLDRVVAALVGGRGGGLEKREREVKVTQNEAHRAIRLRRGVDNAVVVPIDEVRPADADEGIYVARADGQHIDLLGGVAARDLDGQRRTALAERELPADMKEFGDGDRDVAGNLEQIALAEADNQVGGGPRRHLQAGGTAPGRRIRGRAGQEIDSRGLERSILALVDRD